MKSNTLKIWRNSLLVACTISLALAVNSVDAASATSADSGTKENAGAPAPPEGDPVETPPAIPALTPPPLDVSPGMEDIFRLARSGVSSEVLSAYVENSGRAFRPSAEEIIYLKDLGVAPKTIASLIQTGTGETQITREVASGNFQEMENQNAAVPVDGTADRATVSVTTNNHYAAAPQPLADQAAAQTAPPKDESGGEVDLDYFKGALAPYGSWVNVQGVGDCWRPTVSVVNSSWRPYYDGGRWIYSDTGWYWLSDYSWGWAPFHYGRWHMSAGYGWVWSPGYNWGPAWVSWRRTSTYYGWAPLPAYYYGSSWGTGYGYYGGGWGFGIGIGISWGYYNWVPHRYYYGHYPRYYGAPYGSKQEIYNNSTVIKTSIIGDNNTVIINGPNVRAVADASKTEIRRVSVRDVTNLRDAGPKDYIENGGKTLAAFRPTLNSTESRTVTTEARRSRSAGASQTTSAVSVAGRETRRSTSSTATRSTTPRVAGRTAAPSPTTATARTAGTRRTVETLASTSTESVRRSGTRTTPQLSDVRVAGQNTTIRRNPNYRVPTVQSTPILRNGRSIQYNVPVRHTSPVVSGGYRTEATRSRSTYQYPGSTALSSSSRQTVRTPAASRYSRPTTRGTTISNPTRRSSSSYSSPTRTESSRSRATTSHSSPTRSRVTIPASRPPSRSYAPSTRSYSQPSRSYSQPSRSVSRPSYSGGASRSRSAPSFSRSRSSAPSRSAGSRPSGGGSRPTRR